MIEINTDDFHKLNQDEIYEHTYEVFTTRAAPEHRSLGYISKEDEIKIVINDEYELKIDQSSSSFNDSGKRSTSQNHGTTGYVTWGASVLFTKWLMSEKSIIRLNDLTDCSIVELGTGISGVIGSVIGQFCQRYIMTDQKHILKLLKQNIVNNVNNSFTTSTIESELLKDKSSKKNTSKFGNNKKKTLKKSKDKTGYVLPSSNQIEVIDYDWEDSELTYNNVLELNDNEYPDLIFASDTIYNDFLLPFFIQAIDLISDEHTLTFAVIQTREQTVIESFLEILLSKNFDCWFVPDEFLTKELTEGYTVYILKKSAQSAN